MSQNFTHLEQIKGFGKDVNDYLNHYVTVADAKSAALLASNFIILGALNDYIFAKNEICITKAAYIIICACSGISLLLNLYVLFPRLNSGNEKGLIFWENIQEYNKIEDYLDDYRKLGSTEKEEAYAKQNYYVSKVLKKKNSILRISIFFFAISICLSIIFLVASKFS